MIKVDLKEIKQLERDLKSFADRSLPYATRYTLSQAGYHGREFARANVREKMINRNRWTIGSIHYRPARGLDIRRQITVVGSVQPYMADQEFGGVRKRKGGIGAAVPTPYSAGQSENAWPRTRLVRKVYKGSNIRFERVKVRSKSRRARSFVTVRQALKRGDKFVYLETQRAKGIYRVLGGRRATRSGKVKMVVDLSQKSIKIDRNPWLRPAMIEAQKKIPAIYMAALKYQIERQRNFRKK